MKSKTWLIFVIMKRGQDHHERYIIHPMIDAGERSACYDKVDKQLKDDEYIDYSTTLSGYLGRDVLVIK